MKRGQVVTFGVDGRLLNQVRSWAERPHLGVRPSKSPETCLSALQQEGASLVLLKTGRDLECELTLLAGIAKYHPDIATFVIGDTEHPALAHLAWDLGAACVLMPLPSFDHLREAAEAWLPADRSERAPAR